MGFNKHEITTDITKQISRYIVETKYEDIPPAVIERAKNLLLHTLGVSLAALELLQGKDAVALAKELSSGSDKGCATLWGSGIKVSWEAAALLGGTLGDMLDWEDCSWTGHPSAGVIPSAVVAAEVLHKSGKDLLTAIVVAYEVYQRIAMAARANINGLNIFASVVAIAKLHDLNEKQVNQALGLAAACAAVPANIHEATMSDSLNYLYGLKTESAVTIVKNVLLGIENMEDTFDDTTSYADHFDKKSYAPEWFTKEFGTDYVLMDIRVKHWPANMYVQTYAELASVLQKKYRIDPDEIESITLSPAVEFRFYRTDKPYDSLTQAQFNTPYVVAALLYHPERGAVWYKKETLHDPRIYELMNRIHADGFCDEEGRRPLHAMPHLKQLIRGYHPEKTMTIRLKDGKQYSESLFSQPGHPSYMFTREEFQDNFRLETKYVLDPAKQEKIISLVKDLDKEKDAASLAELL